MALWDRDFIEGGIRHHQQQGSSLVFISLSEPIGTRGYRESGAALTRFLRDLNRVCLGSLSGSSRRSGLSWCAVGEWGEKSRRFHWHITVAGLAYPWCKRAHLLFSTAGIKAGDVVYGGLGQSGIAIAKNSTLKPLVARNGFGAGFIGLRHVGPTAGDVGNVSNYLSKYLAKGDAGADLPKGFQLVRASRAGSAWWPGHSLKSVRADHREALREKRRAAKNSIHEVNASPAVRVLTPLRNATQPRLPVGGGAK
jgi:hypothetical protein